MDQNQGITPSEQYLSQLSQKTFLSLWSYPRPFRSQKGCKELCDLLVVFGEHVIIFSDKDIEFSDSSDDQIAWSRWFKKAVWQSAEQVWGAERWIKTYPDRIFTDTNCSIPFPIEFPKPENAKFHRVVVAHGASKKCKQRFGGSGSLMLMTDIIGQAHFENRTQKVTPYAIGQLDPKRGYVHVFDDVTLDIVLNTLDTITDFVQYLQKKERLIESGIAVTAAGEEELLAQYLKELNDNAQLQR